MIFFYLYYKIFKRNGVNVWFPLDLKVRNLFVYSLEEKYIPKADIYIATAMETAIHLNEYKKVESHQKFYLIQALEDWQWGRDAALNTWKLNLQKIVVSPWLKSLAESVGESVCVIENGVDRLALTKKTNISDRDRYTVMMLYHKQKLKGCDDGLKALQIVKKKFPELKSIWFGCPKTPLGLPDWIQYYRLPTEEQLNELYNQSAIFIGPSHSEGFGLTIGEAMSCGCAVVCTNAGGFLTMAKNNETALVSEIGDFEAMASNIIEMMEKDDLRENLATNGYMFIQTFTWDIAYKKFKSLFNS